jgi:hypothetical protein
MVEAYFLRGTRRILSAISRICLCMGRSNELDFFLRRRKCSNFHTRHFEENLARRHRFGMLFVLSSFILVYDFRNAGLYNDLGAFIAGKVGDKESSAFDITGAENCVNFSVTDKLQGIHVSEERRKGYLGWYVMDLRGHRYARTQCQTKLASTARHRRNNASESHYTQSQ